MFEWLFERKDTAESLAEEAYGFFYAFQRLRQRVQTLVTVNEQAQVEEDELYHDAHAVIGEELDDAIKRANDNFNRCVAQEEERHDLVVGELTAEAGTLADSLRLATKVVNFAKEE